MEAGLSTPIALRSPGWGMMSSSDATPPLPPEVLSIILGRLTKNELLKCRLVSSSWNDCCVDMMRKLEYEHRIGICAVKRYVNFVKKTQAQIFLPFRVVVHHSSSDPGYPDGSVDYEKVKKDIDLLLELAGSGSIAAVRFCDRDTTSVKGIHSVLEKISSGLKSVHLSSISRSTLVEVESTSSLENAAMHFPELKKIVIFSRKKIDLEAHSVFFQKVDPPLQVLKFYGRLKIDDIEMKIPFQHLKSLTLRNFRQCALLQEQIRKSPWKPRLERFKFDTGGDVWGDTDADGKNRNIFSALLKEFSATLLYLSSYIPRQAKFQVTFPKLPVLQKLKIRVSAGTEHFVKLSPTKMIVMNFTPAFLPALKHLDTPVGLLCSRPAQYNFIVFETVTSIKLRVWNDSDSTDYLDENPTARLTNHFVKDFLDYIFRMFPNSTRISVKGFGENAHLYIRRVVSAILKAPHASNIQELELENYREDYLGSVLSVLNNPPQIQIVMSNVSPTAAEDSVKKVEEAIKRILGPGVKSSDLVVKHNVGGNADFHHAFTVVDKSFTGHNLTHVRRIRLASTCEKHFKIQTYCQAQKGSYADNKKTLHLDTVISLFPTVELIEISSGMLAMSSKAILKRAREIETRYPNTRIHLI